MPEAVTNLHLLWLLPKVLMCSIITIIGKLHQFLFLMTLFKSRDVKPKLKMDEVAIVRGNNDCFTAAFHHCCDIIDI